MKFLVQTIKNKIKHDFSFVLREAIEYRNWYYDNKEDKIIYTNSEQPEYIDNTVPVGSVEFVSYYLKTYYNKQPKPINVPECLYNYANRKVWVGDEKEYKTPCFCKSHDVIKRHSCYADQPLDLDLQKGEYQYSELIDIDSEWRCFVFKDELVGLQNYSGDFTLFPNLITINNMISLYSKEAPCAYTLDVGVNRLNDIRTNNTFVVEVHDFFSCGLYGFYDLNLLPLMFYRWWFEYINK